jgi:uncharacterized cupin superfamily protein
MTNRPLAVVAAEIPARSKRSNYPEPFASMMDGRSKQAVGDAFGLKNFGVNRTTLIPGAISALHHAHSRQDEMIYVLQGHPTLYTGERQTELHPGMCAGFAAGGAPHHVKNNTSENVIILEIGDRTPGDEVTYPDDDLQIATGADGNRHAAHKNGEPY